MATKNKVLSQKSFILLFIGILLISANLRAPITAVGPLSKILNQEMNLSNAWVGMLTTLPLLAFAVISPLVASVAGKFGNERTLFASMLFLTLGIALRSFRANDGCLFIGTLIIGVAVAFGNVLLPSFIKERLPEKIGVMTGAYTVVMSLFAGLGSGLSIPIERGTSFGWRGSLMVWGLLSLAAVIVMLPLLHAKQRQPAPAGGQRRPTLFFSKKLLTSPLAWYVTLFMGLQSLLFYVLMAWLPSILVSDGYRASQGGWMILVLQIISLPASFLAPVLASRRQSQTGLAVFASVLYVIGFAGMLSGKWMILWIIFLALAGGALISLALLFFTLRTHTAQQAAELSGMGQSGGYLLAALGPVFLGFLHDLTGGWLVPEIILIFLSLIMLVAGSRAGKNKYVESH